jgi:hypothetical protein
MFSARITPMTSLGVRGAGTCFFGRPISKHRIWVFLPLSGCVIPFTGLGSGHLGRSVSMSTSLYEFVLDQLQSAKGRWPQVAEASGVSLRTLEKIARKEIHDPGVSHIEKLATYFRQTDEAMH